MGNVADAAVQFSLRVPSMCRLQVLAACTHATPCTCSSESSKSTFVEQKTIICQSGFMCKSCDELFMYRMTTYRNLIDSAQATILAMRKIGIACETPPTAPTATASSTTASESRLPPVSHQPPMIIFHDRRQPLRPLVYFNIIPDSILPVRHDNCS